MVARVGLGGTIWERAAAPIPEEPEAWQVGATVAGLIRHVVRDASADAPLLGDRRRGPGLVRRSDGLVRHAPNLGWHDVSFGSIVLAALVTRRTGRARQRRRPRRARRAPPRGGASAIDDLVYLSGNVGVGAGVITGGNRLEGAAGYAGEIGHLSFDPRGLAVPLRQPRLLGDRGRRARDRRRARAARPTRWRGSARSSTR